MAIAARPLHDVAMAPPDRPHLPDAGQPSSLLEIESAQDRIGVDRWINEGGRVASDPPERSMSVPLAGRRSGCPRVLIVGGGAAGLETLLALRALAADRVDVTLLAPELKFVNRALAAGQPFEPRAFGVSGWLTSPTSSVLACYAGLLTASSTASAGWSPRMALGLATTYSCSRWVRAPHEPGSQTGC